MGDGRWRPIPEFLENVGAGEADWRFDGMLAVARTAEEAAELTARVSWLTDAGYKAEVLTPWELRALEPSCTGSVETAALFPADGSLDPRLLAAALENAVRLAGVDVLTDARATSIEIGDSRVSGCAPGGRGCGGARRGSGRGRLVRRPGSRIPAAHPALQGPNVRRTR